MMCERAGDHLADGLVAHVGHADADHRLEAGDGVAGAVRVHRG
jgi:hypothetical protein